MCKCHMNLWSALLVLTHHHLHWQRLPLHQLHEKEYVVKVSLCLVMVRFLGCLELFSNSHFSIIRVCSPWVGLRVCRPASCLAMTRTIWSEWTQPWWTLELVFWLFAFDNKDQPPPLHHLENLNSIKVIPLALCIVPLERLLGSSN